MSKKVFHFTATRVVHETSLAAGEVANRLNSHIGKLDPGSPAVRDLLAAENRADIERVVKELTGPDKDFLQFHHLSHHQWLRAYLDNPNIPDAHLYTIGNPLIAQTMLRHDFITGLYVPLRLLVLGNTGGSGSKVIYDLPSSLIIAGHAGGDNAEELKNAAEVLDAKLDRLVTDVTAA